MVKSNRIGKIYSRKCPDFDWSINHANSARGLNLLSPLLVSEEATAGETQVLVPVDTIFSHVSKQTKLGGPRNLLAPAIEPMGLFSKIKRRK